MPFDQFTIEQLAGDMLPEPTEKQRLATAFHRNTMENDEGGTDNEEFRVAAVKDRVDTTVQVWMGLTMGCAKCHSHKYDPISIEDYYSFYAVFYQTEDADRITPVIPFPTAEQRAELKKLENEASGLNQRLAIKPDGFADALAEWKKQLAKEPLWKPLKLLKVKSKKNVTLKQAKNGTLSVEKENPDKDTWVLTLEVPEGKPLTAIRVDSYPKKKGGKWKDKNVALRELTAEWLEEGKKPVGLSLANPRADFSQRGWEVAKAIDGKTNAGWAFSPKAAQPHAAVFDLAKPVTGGRLRLTLEQEYGQGLLFEKFMLSASAYPTKWLPPEIDPMQVDRLKKFNTRNPRTSWAIENGQGENEPIENSFPDSSRANFPPTAIVRTAYTTGKFPRSRDRGLTVPELFGQLPDGAKRTDWASPVGSCRRTILDCTGQTTGLGRFRQGLVGPKRTSLRVSCLRIPNPRLACRRLPGKRVVLKKFSDDRSLENLSPKLVDELRIPTDPTGFEEVRGSDCCRSRP